jgi:hypothetical protein
LPADAPDQRQAKPAIVEQVERLRWRTWNDKAENAQLTVKRIRLLLPVLKSEPTRKLRRALRAVDGYLRGQSAWLANYAERYRAGSRVGTSITEGTANFLVNRRVAKSQQMRWSRRGADRLLQVRCAVYNGALGAAFGQPFETVPNPNPPSAKAAEPPQFLDSPENGYVESFNARLRDELLNGEIFYSLREARVVIESWRRHYNTVRPHASLGFRPPAPEVVLPAFAAWPAAPRSPAPPTTQTVALRPMLH